MQKTIEDLRGEENNKVGKQVIVMDTGIATEDNLALLREEGYDYVCVPLSRPDTKLPAKGRKKSFPLSQISEVIKSRLGGLTFPEKKIISSI